MVRACEVHFLDVGQGSSAVVLFENPYERRLEAIVIDGGPGSTDITAQVLEAFEAYVRAVFITHNHVDHVGGLINVIKTWSHDGKLGQLYLVDDKTAGALKLASTLDDLHEKGRIRWEQLDFLKAGSRYYYATRDGEVVVEVLAPTIPEAIRMKNANEASGVIRLSYDETSLLFCGDSTRPVWERIVSDSGGTPLACEAVAVPHHGGHIDAARSPDNGPWFFTSAVNAQVAVFSFGASNNNKHPRREVVCAAKTQGACQTIFCTEVHPNQNAFPYFGEADGMVQPTLYSRSYQDQTCHPGTDRRHHYACAGSITVGLGPFGADWGHGGDPEPICSFRTIEEFQQKVESAFQRSGRVRPPCHGGACD